MNPFRPAFCPASLCALAAVVVGSAASAQVTDPAVVTPFELIDGTPWLQTPVLRTIKAPTYFWANPSPYPAGDFTKSAMQTIRIPLSTMPASVDLTDVRAVQLRFDLTNQQGCVLIDSIEFTN